MLKPEAKALLSFEMLVIITPVTWCYIP